VLLQGEPCDAAVNFDMDTIEFYNKSITERLCTLNTATLLTRAHLAPNGQSQHKTPCITFRGHSRSRIFIFGSLKSRRWTAYYCIMILHHFGDIAVFCAHDPTPIPPPIPP